MENNKFLVWIDLEMTGLDYEKEVILEIATIITDKDLNIIALGPNIAIHHSDTILNQMDPWCIKQHKKTGLTQKVKESTINMQQAEQETLAFIQKHCEKNTAPLCGNSIWLDKAFLQKHMPNIIDFLHYRIIDVSSFKAMIETWTGKEKLFKKTNAHQALDDIKESIEELKFYKNNYIKLS